MGSGMLPPGAYVTLEHEYILIMRNGPKREFSKPEEKKIRQESAYFWEERNIWFSDIWDFKGTRQKLKNSEARKRSAAYPFELPYRLINMFSVKGDTVFDPFCGTGTTCTAAIAANRNSVSVEIDKNLKETILSLILKSKTDTNAIINKRITNHINFIEKYRAEKKEPGYKNKHHGFPVITNQEVNIHLDFLKKVYSDDDTIIAEYTDENPFQLNLTLAEAGCR
jgi:DNA modification methylase